MIIQITKNGLVVLDNFVLNNAINWHVISQ